MESGEGTLYVATVDAIYLPFNLCLPLLYFVSISLQGINVHAVG